MDRDSFKASKQARKSMSRSESRTNTSSAATDAAAGSPKRYAHGSDQIAQECAAKIYGEGYWLMHIAVDGASNGSVRVMSKAEAGELLANTLESINASPHEPGRRSS